MISAHITVVGDDIVAAELELTGARASDLFGIWPTIIAELEEIEEAQYETMGARSGNRWPAYAQPSAWLWYKFSHNLSLELGKATEMTHAALTNTFAPGAVRDTSFDTLVFGADEQRIPQFAYQQDPAPDAKYPTRRPIDLTQFDTNNFAEAMTGWILGTVNVAGQRVDPQTRKFAAGGNVFR